MLPLALLSGCDAQGAGTAAPSADASPSPSEEGSPPVGDAEHAVPAPGPLRAPLRPPDLLVTSEGSFDDALVARIAALPGVVDVEKLAVAQVSIENRVVTVAAVDPGSYRRFTPAPAAQAQDVWTRVAGGELAVVPRLGRRLVDAEGFVSLGNDRTAPRVHVGALAPQIPRVDAVVNDAWASELGMVADNALLVSTARRTAPQVVRPRIERVVGSDAPVQILGPDLDISVEQTAVLTGGSVAASVGSFRYRVLPMGRIAPDPAWVAANIRTERVPILGAVTCHRVVLPQLRAALAEVVAAGLAGEVHPKEYAGCYYPRYIAGTTRLSLHSFGIALDLNVPGNRRGTVGEMDRGVVAIFKRWGFAWGGDWSYTDPMHFEMNALVAPG
jgi:hypothetical protein